MTSPVQVWVQDDVLLDARRFLVRMPGEIELAVSKYELEKADPYSLLTAIEEQIMRHFRRELHKELIEALSASSTPKQWSLISKSQNQIPGLTEKFPALEQTVFKCPAQKCVGIPHPLSLRQMIIHLNDQDKWTREQIADWLEESDYDITIKEPAA